MKLKSGSGVRRINTKKIQCDFKKITTGNVLLPVSLKAKIPLPSKSEKELGYFKLTSLRLFKLFAFLKIFTFQSVRRLKSDNVFTLVAVSPPFIEGEQETIVN